MTSKEKEYILCDTGREGGDVIALQLSATYGKRAIPIINNSSRDKDVFMSIANDFRLREIEA